MDLRYGSFVMRETDLYVTGSIEIPLTRTYTSTDWLHRNHIHAFGQNTNHAFDIAPVGSRNPYTYLLVLPGRRKFPVLFPGVEGDGLCRCCVSPFRDLNTILQIDNCLEWSWLVDETCRRLDDCISRVIYNMIASASSTKGGPILPVFANAYSNAIHKAEHASLCG